MRGRIARESIDKKGAINFDSTLYAFFKKHIYFLYCNNSHIQFVQCDLTLYAIISFLNTNS